jgi:hypothetical protein
MARLPCDRSCGVEIHSLLRTLLFLAQCGLTLPSSGQSTGCARRLPLKSNVRRRPGERIQRLRVNTAFTCSPSLSAIGNACNRRARQKSLASSGAVALPLQAPSTWAAAGARAVRAPPMSRLTPITSPAPAPKHGRAQMLSRVTVPAPASVATARLLGGAGMVQWHHHRHAHHNHPTDA